MDAAELRTLQAPIKQHYRDQPADARIVARSECRLDRDDIACVVATSHGEVVAGLHEAAGGTGALACSADMLLDALVACAGTTLKAVATAMSIPLRGGRIVAEGIWDVRGTLGIDRATPAGLTEINLRFEIDGDAEPDKIKRLIETTERYCVILQTLQTPPRVTTEITRPASPAPG